MSDTLLILNDKGWRGPITVSETPDFGGSWRRRAELANKTATVDFGCGFRNGQCNGQRDKKALVYFKHTERACCGSCAEQQGYLSTIAPWDVSLVKQLFNPVTGFWREGAGCILPREHRSPTCLTYTCGAACKAITGKMPTNSYDRGQHLPIWLKRIQPSRFNI